MQNQSQMTISRPKMKVRHKAEIHLILISIKEVRMQAARKVLKNRNKKRREMLEMEISIVKKSEMLLKMIAKTRK